MPNKYLRKMTLLLFIRPIMENRFKYCNAKIYVNKSILTILWDPWESRKSYRWPWMLQSLWSVTPQSIFKLDPSVCLPSELSSVKLLFSKSGIHFIIVSLCSAGETIFDIRCNDVIETFNRSTKLFPLLLQKILLFTQRITRRSSKGNT